MYHHGHQLEGPGWVNPPVTKAEGWRWQRGQAGASGSWSSGGVALLQPGMSSLCAARQTEVDTHTIAALSKNAV